jgi:AraC-like DNA-binding protein
LKFPPGRAYFQIVQGAPCQLHAIGEKRPLSLAPGDVVVLPHGQGHRIERGASSNEDKKYPHMAPAARVTTGVFEIEGLYGDTLVRGLPRFLHVPGTAGQRAPLGGAAEWLPMTIAAMEQELRHPSIGSTIMLSRIADLLFIWAIRYWLASSPRAIQKGWIAALLDPAISHALSLLHADPGYDWTVSQLATHTSQSRSNFSRRFVELIGESPMRYLTNWRMQLASQLLSSSNQRVSEIAEGVGYASQAAFSRVFQRTFGNSPSGYRGQFTNS